MKTLVAALAFASLVATSAVARTGKVPARHSDANNIYQSYSQGQQSYPNPDRDFYGPNAANQGN